MTLIELQGDVFAARDVKEIRISGTEIYLKVRGRWFSRDYNYDSEHQAEAAFSLAVQQLKQAPE